MSRNVCTAALDSPERRLSTSRPGWFPAIANSVAIVARVTLLDRRPPAEHRGVDGDDQRSGSAVLRPLDHQVDQLFVGRPVELVPVRGRPRRRRSESDAVFPDADR